MSKPANADVRSLWASWYEPVTAAPGLLVPANQNTPPAIADNDNRPSFAGSYDGTLAGLVACYLADPVSPFQTTRHFTKISYGNLCRRLVADHGAIRIADLKYRSLLEWQRTWAATGQVAMTHALFAMLRITIRFGATILEQQDCERAAGILQHGRDLRPILEEVFGQKRDSDQVRAGLGLVVVVRTDLLRAAQTDWRLPFSMMA